MIPLKDDVPTETFPIDTILIIGINIFIFLYQASLGIGGQRLVYSYGIMPYEIIRFKDIAPTIPYPIYATLFTSMFLHGGFFHLAGNMLYLWIFGNNVEDAVGHFKFLIFYFTCGIAAGFLYIILNPNSKVPLIGASGAISGILGAYLLLYPRARVHTLIIFIFFVQIIKIPAVIVLGFWIIIQILNYLSSIGTVSSGGIAWLAHIGGFFAGLFLIRYFKKTHIKFGGGGGS
ncbi:MAG: rhomboid family intramembrane serine protease [bacterium]